MGYRFAADVVLLVHAGFVAFVILGLVLTLVGGLRGWRWVHRPTFRLAHLAAIGLVVVQAVLGMACPLTTLENTLRLKAAEEVYPGGFIAYWLHQVLFFQADPAVFTAIYCLFGLLVLGTLWRVPVEWRGRRLTPTAWLSHRS